MQKSHKDPLHMFETVFYVTRINKIILVLSVPSVPLLVPHNIFMSNICTVFRMH